MITDRILDETDAEINKYTIDRSHHDFFGATPHSAHFVDFCWTFCRDADES